MFVTIVDQPEDAVVDDFLVSETGFVRVLIRGDWDTVIDGSWRPFSGALLFGAQSRPFRARVRGPFATAGFAILPGAWTGLLGPTAEQMTDRVADLPAAVGDRFIAATSDIDDVDLTLDRLNAAAARWIVESGGAIDGVAEAFESMSHADPCRPVAEIASAIGVSSRTLTRRVTASFGVSPKRVLRRSRFLDMAAVVRGLAVADEGALAALRFYDQSHRVREFRHFAGMTPRDFERTPTPLFTLGLETRQRRKFENSMPGPHRVPWLS